MLSDRMLRVSERRTRPWGMRRAGSASGDRSRNPKRTTTPPHEGTRRRSTKANRVELPEGWPRRVREQTHNLARAVDMVEQAVTMMNESRSEALARAERLRAAALITMLAAAELLVIAGWFEADQAVRAGTLER